MKQLVMAAFDALLLLSLLWLAWKAIFVRENFRSVVLFIAYGLFMALTWVRLQAPDVALAEAAIGAGLTGALLLSTAAALDKSGRSARDGEGSR